jgi:two-component system cell cycle response regulator
MFMAEQPAKKILLIDDHREGHELLLRMVAHFHDSHWEMDWAETYASGLKKMLTRRYDVCLLDYHLDGGHNGLELLREARAADNTTPVVFLTGDLNPGLDDKALEAGAMDFLVKTEITPRLLEHSIRYSRKLGEMVGQLRQQATRDELTGLQNRREFDRLLHEEWQRSARFKHSFALAILDIDFFKKVNDTHGHQVGDEVLRHVASLLAGQVRTVDRLARYGGEEFALFMVEATRAEAHDAIDRLRTLLAETPCIIPKKDLTIEVTISGGVAAMPEDAETLDKLVAAADAALYTAKRLGRNRVVTTKMRATNQPWQVSANPIQTASSPAP